MGLLNGLLIGMVRISPFVVTLGTMSIYTSVILVVTHGSTVSLFNYPKFNAIQTLANQDVGPLPIILPVIVALYLIAWFVLHRTSFGRAVYAVGSNPEAARLNGLNVPVTLLLVYAVAGLTYALGAIQQDGRLTAAVPIVDPNQMLAVIAAVLIGGMSMRGGEGGLLGTLHRRAVLGGHPERADAQGGVGLLAGDGHRPHPDRRGGSRGGAGDGSDAQRYAGG